MKLFIRPPRARWIEWLGRWALGMALVAIIYGLFSPYLQRYALSFKPESLAMPRLLIFLLSAMVILLFQGARPSVNWLWPTLVLASASAFLLLPWVKASGGPQIPWSRTSQMLQPGFEIGWILSSLTAAIALGTLAARTLKRPAHLLAVVLCAAAGDAWFSALNASEVLSPGHPLWMLQLSWPPSLLRMPSPISFVDIMFLALYLEAAQMFRFHAPSVLFGALGGYLAASLLAFASWSVMLTLPMTGLGVLMGAWPDFKCTSKEVFKAFATAILLFAILLGCSALRRSYFSGPEKPNDFHRLRDVA